MYVFLFSGIQEVSDISSSVYSESCRYVGWKAVLTDLLLILNADNKVFFHLIQYKQALFHYCLNRREVSESRDLGNKEISQPHEKSHKRGTYRKNSLT